MDCIVENGGPLRHVIRHCRREENSHPVRGRTERMCKTALPVRFRLRTAPAAG